MAKKARGSVKREKSRERRERQFEPAALTSKWNVYAVGGVGSALMGAGAWGQFGGLMTDGGPEPYKYAPYILAAGALLVGVAIWIGTSGDSALRVGDGGIAVVKSGLRRMPWYAVERVEWSDGAIRVTGKDEAGVDMIVVATLESHAQAAAWIVKEARERVPSTVGPLEDAGFPSRSRAPARPTLWSRRRSSAATARRAARSSPTSRTPGCACGASACTTAPACPRRARAAPRWASCAPRPARSRPEGTRDADPGFDSHGGRPRRGDDGARDRAGVRGRGAGDAGVRRGDRQGRAGDRRHRGAAR